MAAESEDWIGRAKEAGASDSALVALLVSRGRTEAEAWSLLGRHYESSLGIVIPPLKRGVVSNPLDGFVYTFFVVLLGWWVFGVLTLWAALTDRWFQAPDQYSGGTSWQMSFSLSIVLVTTPVLLIWLRWMIARVASGATNNDSPVRVWLLSLAMLAAGVTVLGFLIASTGAFISGDSSVAFWVQMAGAIPFVALVGGLLYFWLNQSRRSS
ncbi:MAG: DUF5671 domain-containing protein [Fimbriimonadaceae bacterium]|nr:DUF5671 domain-containing protein [Fimbriimonadaceae bacterium]